MGMALDVAAPAMDKPVTGERPGAVMASASERRDYLRIVDHYESCLRDFRDGPGAVNWKSAEDAATRYDVMLGIIRDRRAASSLLDFGCGLAELKPHMERAGYAAVRYSGLDISPQFAVAARARFPQSEILCFDVLDAGQHLPTFDYVIMNGIFTRRHDLGMDDMWRYFERLVHTVFESCRVGLAFNVMSSVVDWQNEALFHPEPGRMIAFLGGSLTRHFVMRNDYGLHETTYYLFREPGSTLAG
jgi:SAM-dependent methyltransferase